MDYLLDETVVKRYEITYAKGYDHLYPNENIVCLVKWFFKANKGLVLDYGFGCGENLLHLLKCGYEVEGIEVSKKAFGLTMSKINKNAFENKYSLKLLTAEDERLPYVDNHFDFILSNQTVYFLNSGEKIRRLLFEFKRILKPKGRLIITMMSRFNMGCIDGKPMGNNCYEYGDDGDDVPKELPNRVYVVRDENHARKLFDMFNIIEIGYFDNYYCGVSGHHWVILGENK